MGTSDVYASQARAAQRPASRGERYSGSRGSYLGGGIRAFQTALQQPGTDRFIERYLASSRAQAYRQRRGHACREASVKGPTIGFAGMTHLGLVSATAIASRGFATVCFDADAALIEKLKVGELPISEPDLAELLSANGTKQSFTPSIADLGK